MYRVCYLCLILIDLPVCPTYELLHVLFSCIVYVLYVLFLSLFQSVHHMNYCRCCFYVSCMFLVSYSYRSSSLSNIWIIAGVVFMYRVCSLCLILIDLPVCPPYELLQVLFLCIVYVPCVLFLSLFQSVQHMNYCRCYFYISCMFFMSYSYRSSSLSNVWIIAGVVFMYRVCSYVLFLSIFQSVHHMNYCRCCFYVSCMFLVCYSYRSSSLSNIWIIAGVVFMYRVCSLCLIPIDLTVCPIYELLQVLFSCIVYVLYVLFLSIFQSVQRMNYCRCCILVCISH